MYVSVKRHFIYYHSWFFSIECVPNITIKSFLNKIYLTYIFLIRHTIQPFWVVTIDRQHCSTIIVGYFEKWSHLWKLQRWENAFRKWQWNGCPLDMRAETSLDGMHIAGFCHSLHIQKRLWKQREYWFGEWRIETRDNRFSPWVGEDFLE